MRQFFISNFILLFLSPILGQTVMTPETLWSLGRVTGLGISKDGKQAVYKVTTPSIVDDKLQSKFYSIDIVTRHTTEIKNTKDQLHDLSISPNGLMQIEVKEVKVHHVQGSDIYPDLPKSNVQIYGGLNYRHWDTWEDGLYSHLFVKDLNDDSSIDIMPFESHDCPTKPFGAAEDYTWSPDGNAVLYVTKKKSGTAYAVSTNSDIYSYSIKTKKTINLTEGMMGYDKSPQYSLDGILAWTSMAREGFEADKNDIYIQTKNGKQNLTKHWDGTVNSFKWSNDGTKIYFNAPIGGTVQLFEIDVTKNSQTTHHIKQITNGQFDINGLVGQIANTLIVSRTDMNHAAELYTVNLNNGEMQQLTHINDVTYNAIQLSKVEKRFVKTTDKKQMTVWVIYPPNFDPNKKYPTLLYCQGGPQSALSQTYSFRWNFQLMAANGYIIVAPNRRGMPGHGVAWNEQISKDHGGQVMDDYLSAIDAISKEPYVDKSRLGCVGASYGGYSAFFLAGIHNKRFKTFISHDGIFNLKSMYGTTEELFFVDWDLGGPYWDKKNKAAQKTYKKFDPMTNVGKWDTPILIFQGGKDYRVPDGQAFEAFQAAQLRGIKSKLVYLPDENHWVLHAQNAIVWQREFFGWLKETL